MPVYRKKPVEIEAILLNHTVDPYDVAKWCGGNVVDNHVVGKKIHIIIPTLEGEMKADFMDYIIKGVNGEFYPCKPDIFVKTYDFVREY